jgi:hypothetical protein
MTRTSNNKLSAMAGGLALASAGVAIAQETGGERHAPGLADAAITQRYNTQIEQQLRSQERGDRFARAADREFGFHGRRRAVDAAEDVRRPRPVRSERRRSSKRSAISGSSG